jgi:hypothetical protein
MSAAEGNADGIAVKVAKRPALGRGLGVPHQANARISAKVFPRQIRRAVKPYASLLAFPLGFPFKGRNILREGFDKSFRGFEEFPGFRDSGVLNVGKRTHSRGI